MEAFTDAATGTNPTAAAMTSSTSPTTTPASVPNQNAGSTATITTSFATPKKHCSPSTPNSTPLHRRFLRAVSMPPPTPSCPPMEGQRPSEKARDSPVVVRHTPQKTHQSPMKLEVAPGAFYFSIELPASKITSTKSGTKSKTGTPKGGHTPTRTQTPSPLKNARPTKENPMDTPPRATRSPLKRDETAKQSPAKTLFGTPTRTRMHRQDTDPRTPIRATPSPRKNHSPVKQSPASRATSSPKRKKLVNTAGRSRPGSPVKRSIEQDHSPVDPLKTSARLARKLLSEPEDTLGIPSECLVDLKEEGAPPNLVATATINPAPLSESTGQASPAKKCPENIGHLMASLISNTTSTRDWASAYNDNMISPIPTPLRKASEKLELGESPYFLRMSANGSTAMTNVDPATDTDKRGSLTLHEPAAIDPHEPAAIDPRRNESEPARRLSSGLYKEASSPTITADQATELVDTVNVSTEPRPARPLRAASLGYFTTLNATCEIPAPPHRPLLFPKRRSEVQQNEPPQEGHPLKWHAMENPIQKPLPASQQRRAGTDPSVLLKMQKDMANLEATMRRSAGVVDSAFCGPLNLNELPAMSNEFFIRDPQDVRSPGAVGTPQSLSRANSDNASIGAVQPKGGRGTSKSMSSSRVTGTSVIPRWRPGGPTPAKTMKDRLVAAKQESSQRTGAGQTIVPGRSRPRAATTVSTARKSTAVTSAPRKTPATPAKQVALPESTTHSSPPSRIPSITSAKPKTSTRSIPQITQKPLPNAPGHGKAVPALKDRLPNVPTAPINTRPVPVRKPLCPPAANPHEPPADSRPYEQEFASAGDIADRLARWHDEDRRKAQMNRRTATAKTPISTPAAKRVESQLDESTTPDGSPAKILTPAKAPASTSTSKLLAIKDAKSRPLSTKNSAPSTPKCKPSATAPKTPVQDPRNAAALNKNLRQPVAATKTPVNRRIPVLDRNATRTPSKAIVSSLDRAIDRKIAEDARGGLEFTPGGNRLKDLLDAKSKDATIVQILEE
jgi:hypothetical protein